MRAFLTVLCFFAFCFVCSAQVRVTESKNMVSSDTATTVSSGGAAVSEKKNFISPDTLTLTVTGNGIPASISKNLQQSGGNAVPTEDKANTGDGNLRKKKD